MAKQLRTDFDVRSGIVPVKVVNLGQVRPQQAPPKRGQEWPAGRGFVLDPLTAIQQDGKPGSFILVDGYWRFEALKRSRGRPP